MSIYVRVTLLALVATAASACAPREETPDPEEPAVSPAPSEPPVAAPTEPFATDEARTRCETAEDCVISCVQPENCCGQLCTCTNAYSRAFVDWQREWTTQNCADAICPAADCTQVRDGHYEVACVESACALFVSDVPQ